MLRFLMYLHNLMSTRLGDRGATAVEYGLIVTLIAVVIIGVVTNIGVDLRNEFQTVVNSL